jgi:hypothetical protein
MVPVRYDDVVGEPVVAVLDTPIALEDRPRSFDIPMDPMVSNTVTFPEQVDILLSTTSGFCGFEVLKSGTSYMPREKHVGRIVRVVNDTVDLVLGEVVPGRPHILGVTISSPDWQVGSVVTLSVSHKQVRAEFLQIVWLREKTNFQKAVAIDVPEYYLTTEDVGYRIRAVATPLDIRRNLLDAVYSAPSPVITNAASCEPTIAGDLVEGSTISLSFPIEMASVQWFRSAARHKFTPISTEREYVLSNADVGSFISVVGQTVTNRRVTTGSRSSHSVPSTCRD